MGTLHSVTLEAQDPFWSASLPEEAATTHAAPSDELSTNREELHQSEAWKLASRIVASRGFSRSDLLQRFLLHVCELQLTGRSDLISEQRIGIQIFNRAEDYDPGEDNIVRSYARLLRKRLDAYFEREGSQEALRISIPRGGYVPIFEVRASSDSSLPEESSLNRNDDRPASPALAEEAEKSRSHGMTRRRIFWKIPTLCTLAGMALAAAAISGWQHLERARQQSTVHPVWSSLFQPNRNTLIVPADSGLGILQNLSHHLVGVEEYANGSYLNQMHLPAGMDANNINDLSRQRYTSVVDLNIATALARLPEYEPTRTQVRYARSITAEDLKTSNVILIGSKHTNPWVAIYEPGMNFRLQYEPEVDASLVQNLHPRTGEQSSYRNGSGSTAQSTYGVIAYLSGNSGGHVLIVEGLNMAATQAAADVLLNGSDFAPILQEAHRRDGTLSDFELLVETTSIGAASPDARIIAHRIYQTVGVGN